MLDTSPAPKALLLTGGGVSLLRSLVVLARDLWVDP